MIQGKVWGKTELLLRTPMIEVHKIFIAPNACCSTHMHKHKWNGFYCLAGAVDIIVQKNDYELTDITHLSEGMMTSVPPGEYHSFQTGVSDARVLEIYWIDGITEDIIRKNVGRVAEVP